MAGKIRAGVIGTGLMGSVHARAIQAAGAPLSMVSGHAATLTAAVVQSAASQVWVEVTDGVGLTGPTLSTGEREETHAE
ncbi:MAG: hypothetical protein JWN06_4010 [Propionibacteriaceae bacterium]|jgi:prephenate dehydrogenase|nr:hypothetical protein [Propionibacteriaceae bacterium]